MRALGNGGPASVRRQGLRRLLTGLGVFAAGLTIPLFILPMFHRQLAPPGMILFALPGAYAVSGLIELITGVRFVEFARRWDELKAWQRGVIGASIVLAASLVIVCVFALILSRL